MKEQEVRLTRKPDASTLKGEGNFMPIDTEHESPPPEAPENASGSIKPEDIEAAKRIFRTPDAHVDWNTLPVDVRRAAIEAIKNARGPRGLGAPPTSPEEVNAHLRRLIEERSGRDERGAISDDDLAEENSQFMESLRKMYAAGLQSHAGSAEENSPYAEASQRELEARRKEWLNPQAREEYFNSFFALVDEIPHESFEAILSKDWTKSRDYFLFLEFILKGSQGDFGALEKNPDGSPKPLKDNKGNLITDRDNLITELKEDLARFQEERRMRQSVHDIKIALVVASLKYDEFAKSVQWFESKLGDVALRQKGVLQMMKIYEEVLRENMRANKGFLEPEFISGIVKKDDKTGTTAKVLKGEAETKTKERFRELLRKSLIVTRDNNGKAVPVEFTESEIQKAYAIAQGMMLVDGRLISIMAESTLPKKSGQYISLFLQDIISGISPYRHSVAKFGLGRGGIAALLGKDKKTRKFLNIFSMWNPRELKKTLDKYEKNHLSILQQADEYFYIMRQNPNRAGDVFTWLSWRVDTDEEVESMLKDYLKSGIGKMIGRWDRLRPNAPRALVYEKAINDIDIDLDKDSRFKAPKNADQREIDKLEEKKKTERARRLGQLPFGYTGVPTLKEFDDYVHEYSDWIGTGLRFEKMRSSLFKLEVPEGWEDSDSAGRMALWKAQKIKLQRSDKNEDQERSGNMGKAEELLKRMVELQPQRLYRISQRIRDKMDENELFTPELKGNIDIILNNLSLLESVFLKERENLLDNGKRFGLKSEDPDSISLDDFYDNIENPQERKMTEDFARLLAEDFRQHTDLYLEEFIYRREYTHGFVLWSEDVPIDEFNMTKLGPTGGFARKARDNDAVREAGSKEIDLFNSLRHITEPEELYKVLEEIHKDITRYDASKADAVIAEILEGIGKFFAPEWQVNIPGYGMLDKKFGKSSFARFVYGRNAPLWSATKIRDLYAWAKDKQFISPEDYKRLNENSPSSKADVAVDIGVTLSQLLAIALILYLIQKSTQERSR